MICKKCNVEMWDNADSYRCPNCGEEVKK